jgi:phosphoribosylglycinamide formyltransferase-1
MLPIVVLISGTGSNLQAIIDARARGELPVEICAVVSNNPRAPGLERARRAGIPAIAIDHAQYAAREQFDAALQTEIDSFAPRLVVLAGFMRILTPAFVAHYAGRLLNVHPSLLPKYRGLNTHQRALDAGDTEHGASIHYVTTELDGGPVVLQARVPVLPGDTAQTLRARVQEQEHRIYPLAIRWIAENRLQWRDDRAWFDERELVAPIQYSP